MISELLMLDAGGEERLESDGLMRGVAVGVVTDNQDPEKLGRVKVRLAYHEPGQDTFWARLAVPMAMANRGTYFLPEVDDEVLVAFERGDIAHPFVVGSLWHGQNPPPETNEDGKNDMRVIRTRAESELRFNDGDAPSIEVKLADGKHVVLDDSGILVSDGSNEIQIESQSGNLTVRCGGALSLQGQSVSIKSDASMELNASGTLTIKGAMVMIN